MATSKKYTVTYRRKREGKTDYKQRLLLIKSRQPRIVVRKSQKHIIMQVIEYSQKGDIVKLTSHTGELKKYGWKGATNNLSAAYLCGVLAAKKAKDKKIPKCIPDLGKYTSVKGSIIYAAIKGAQDNGLTIPCAKEVYPNESRIKGEHIAQWATQLKKTSKEKYAVQFSKCIKNGLDPENITKHFEETLKKIKNPDTLEAGTSSNGFFKIETVPKNKTNKPQTTQTKEHSQQIKG